MGLVKRIKSVYAQIRGETSISDNTMSASEKYPFLDELRELGGMYINFYWRTNDGKLIEPPPIQLAIFPSLVSEKGFFSYDGITYYWKYPDAEIVAIERGKKRIYLKEGEYPIDKLLKFIDQEVTVTGTFLNMRNPEDQKTITGTLTAPSLSSFYLSRGHSTFIVEWENRKECCRVDTIEDTHGNVIYRRNNCT